MRMVQFGPADGNSVSVIRLSSDPKNQRPCGRGLGVSRSLREEHENRKPREYSGRMVKMI